jgi:hypothetical protein
MLGRSYTFFRLPAPHDEDAMNKFVEAKCGEDPEFNESRLHVHSEAAEADLEAPRDNDPGDEHVEPRERLGPI